MRTPVPAAYTGLDLNPAGVDFCRKASAARPGFGAGRRRRCKAGANFAVLSEDEGAMTVT